MYSINFDILGKNVLVKALEKEREIYQQKILEGDESPGTLIMHEQLYKLTRGILYARAQKKEAEASQETIEDQDQLEPSVSTNSLSMATTEPSEASTTRK